MLSNLVYLILVLLLINFVNEAPVGVLVASPYEAFAWGMGLYACLLGLIVYQNKRLRSHRLNTIVNLEILFFLLIFHFGLAGGRILAQFHSQTLQAAFSLGLYMFALWLFYRTSRPREHSQLRILLPFVIPFVLFSILIDVFPSWVMANTNEELAFTIGLGIVFVVLIMTFLPVLIQWIWKCRTIPDKELLNRLEAVCQKARFKHAGIKIWTVLHSLVTAAIVGIVPRFRYIIFTERMLQEFRPEELEAVLAHEIGHSYHKHLVMYPFIIGGMITCASFFGFYFGEPIAQAFSKGYEMYPSKIWSITYPLAIFMPYVLIMAIYFRLVFGFFSRLFERQADLHVFKLGMPPQQMIEALDRVGIVTGYTHYVPSWHHYSIQQRIHFLHAAIANPSLVKQQDQKVRIFFCLYLIVFIVMTTFLFKESSR